MEKIIKLIDNYIKNYNNYGIGKHSLECEYGEIIFYKDKKNINNMIVQGIYIKPEFRKQGLCKSIFNYIIENFSSKFKYFCVQSVISKILYEYLLRFEYNNKHFILKKNGFFYKL